MEVGCASTSAATTVMGLVPALEPGEVRWEKSSRHDTSFAEEDLLVFETDIDLVGEVEDVGENVRALKGAD